jgi:hypothetical protein
MRSNDLAPMTFSWQDAYQSLSLKTSKLKPGHMLLD